MIHQKIASLCVLSGLLACGVAAQAASNVAPLGTATQSSQYSSDFNSQASNAIDGVTAGNYYDGNVNHTNAGSGYGVGNGFEWWSVTLDKSYLVSDIVVWNRTDCCTERLSDFTVSLFNQGALVQSQVYSSSAPAYTSGTFGAIGDRVLVQLNHQDYLHLAEVQVFAAAVPEPESYALMMAGLGAVSLVARRRKATR